MRFCGECAAPLLDGVTPSPATVVGFTPASASRSITPVAERRLVTVLFADLVGFTTLAEGRDAEDTRELLSRYFELARDVIGRYGGTVEKFIGDAVMAVWGAPTAHEDDAERAVRAALDLVGAIRSLGPGIEARAGVLTGEAAVTVGATDQGMVAGDLVNTASRLQSVAAPGTVLVGEATQRASSAAIAFEAAGEQALKGRIVPVPAWRALRVVAERRGRRRADTLEAPFVGGRFRRRVGRPRRHAGGPGGPLGRSSRGQAPRRATTFAAGSGRPNPLSASSPTDSVSTRSSTAAWARWARRICPPRASLERREARITTFPMAP